MRLPRGTGHHRGGPGLRLVIEQASLVAGRIPGAGFQLIREVGHMLSLEVSARFSRVVPEFVVDSSRR
jgi:hypothetical protein